MNAARITGSIMFRPIPMTVRAFAFAASLAAASVVAPAMAQAQATPFKDTSVFKQLPGHPVVLYEWEDMECPACAADAPIVLQAVEHYKIPYERHDFLIPGHTWSKQAAITARYLQDKVNPAVAENYRQDVFKNQQSIASPDDLGNFTHRWFDAHHLQMPFVMDPNGLFAAEVQSDVREGDRFGLIHTPTIVVVGPKGMTEVQDITQLYTIIDNAQAQVKSAPAVHNNLKRPVKTPN
jgi:protein-disulfide isomerase